MRAILRSILTDLTTIAGVACLLAGLYLWLGPPAPLLAGGVILIYAGAMLARQEDIEHEPNETTNT